MQKDNVTNEGGYTRVLTIATLGLFWLVRAGWSCSCFCRLLRG